MLDLAFQWYEGRVEGSGITVYARRTERYENLAVSWLIVGASHLVHYRTPHGEWTEAIADPTRLPPGARFAVALGETGSFEEGPFRIEWRILPWDEALLEEVKGFPLVHDFGGGAITALSWTRSDALVTETYHAYPEHQLLVQTRSRLEAP